MPLPTELTTHPTRSYAREQHKADLNGAVEEIRKAVAKGLPNSQSRFQNVAVFLFHWSNDDLNVAPLEDELAKVFAEMYNFEVVRYVIGHAPAIGGPSMHLFRAITDFFLERDGPHNLLIYVYSGRSWSGFSGRESRLYGRSHPPPYTRQQPDIDWAGLHQSLDGARANTLCIFYTCFAAAGALYSGEMEYLAAAAMENPATANHSLCFTKRLMELLVRNIQTPMSVASMHATLISEMSMPEHELANALLYIPAASKPSSVICPLKADPTKIQAKLGKPVLSPISVLVSFHLAGKATIPSVEAFKKYLLTQVPADVAQITIDSAYNGDSQILLLRMPIEIWSSLKESRNFAFVGFVTGGDVLKTGSFGGEIGLAERPKGIENVPTSSQQGFK